RCRGRPFALHRRCTHAPCQRNETGSPNRTSAMLRGARFRVLYSRPISMTGPQMHEIVVPNRPAFKASEVCEIAHVQPYVLRSWENEFPELGVSRTPGGPRVYRKADVER